VLGEHGSLVEFIHEGMDDEVVAKIPHLPRGEGVLGSITRSLSSVRINDVSEHPDAAGFPEHHPAMESFLGVPVRVGDRIFGNLYLTDKPGGFTEEDELLGEFLAVTAGAAVSTLRLQERIRRAALHEDRERIARDLHDSIIQDLFAVGLSLQTATNQVSTQPNVVRDRLVDAVDRLDVTIAALRRYIFDLRPPVWARPGLATEVSRLVADIAEPYGVDVGSDVDCPPGVPSPPVTDHVLAVVKESVSNALRHSGARTVDVRVACSGKELTVNVADNGSGFDPVADSDGMGLSNLERRVEAVGGKYELDTAPGKGTVVSVVFPLGDD
jgi:signal transduction histidine kinase